MGRWLLALLLLPATGAAAPPDHFDVEATFEAAAAPGGDGAVAVRFYARDPDLRLNASPAPRLTLDLLETVLVDRQPKAPKDVPEYDPATAKYLDLDGPVRFPVAVAGTATPGSYDVQAKVVYFYCSVREAWCRRGTADVDVAVRVP